MRTRLVSAMLATAAVAIGVFAGAGTASAHVTVNPREAVQGGYGKFSFRVPNEKDGASTVKLEVVIPTETAIASVSTRPVPGWTVTVERSTLPTPLKVHDSEVTEAVSKITWTATEGNAVAPGQFQEFDVSAGPLPAVDRIVFKALQTYSDGEVFRWIEEPVDGQPQPERPAPVLKLTTATAAAATGVNAAPAGGPGAVTRSVDTPAWVLPLVLASLVVAVGALVLALVAWRRRPAAA
jgi:periplasmic copper chaperone A